MNNASQYRVDLNKPRILHAQICCTVNTVSSFVPCQKSEGSSSASGGYHLASHHGQPIWIFFWWAKRQKAKFSSDHLDSSLSAMIPLPQHIYSTFICWRQFHRDIRHTIKRINKRKTFTGNKQTHFIASFIQSIGYKSQLNPQATNVIYIWSTHS